MASLKFIIEHSGILRHSALLDEGYFSKLAAEGQTDHGAAPLRAGEASMDDVPVRGYLSGGELQIPPAATLAELPVV
jgi:hypothetical protein